MVIPGGWVFLMSEVLPLCRPRPRQVISALYTEREEFFIDNLLVRIHFIIVMIWWTGLAL